MSGERQRCVDAGANDYVPKPVDAVDLLAPSARGSPQRRMPRRELELSFLESHVSGIGIFRPAFALRRRHQHFGV